ncbi:hypothetical protein FPV67DRAFT_751678 [Lyophyllum atratum]|nr:hypothetical protein FPV67DRAFT_751678 [Lyophyllum atratum]
MRGLNSLPLDDDIIERILTFLPNFPTLLATISSSRSFYNLFKNHPNSILRAVAYNLTGPALPQAIRVLRYSDLNNDAETDSSEPPPPRAWQESDPVSPITNEECQDLARNAEVVNALEDLFSWRHKDRTSRTSVLDSMESWRFRRAVYRAMLFSKAFPLSDYEDMADEPADPDELEELRLRRKNLLQELSDSELRALHSVSLFLKDVARWPAEAQLSSPDLLDTGDVVLACGPAIILESYRTQSLCLVGDLLFEMVPDVLEEYMSYPLDVLWEERKIKPPPDDLTHWKSILDVIHGEQDTCKQCNDAGRNIQGFAIWNETSWDYLKGVSADLTVYGLRNLSKGTMLQSRVDGIALVTRLIDRHFSYTQFLEEIHEVRTPPYDSWNKQDWICAPCFEEIIRCHLHLWLLERKKADGVQIPEDCWYGYNCKTQVHNLDHANRRNHLCEPTR